MHPLMNELAEQHAADLRTEAAEHRCTDALRVRRTPIRATVGRALVRLGERLAAAPTRAAASQ